MKKSIIVLLVLTLIFSNLPAYAFDVFKDVKLGDEIVLPSTVEYEGTEKSVTWSRTKLKSVTKGIIHVTGETEDGENVDLYIVVGEHKATVSLYEPDINFNEKTAEFSADISGSESEYAALFIFNKNDLATDLSSAFELGRPVYTEGMVTENGKAEFSVDMSGFSGGNYVSYITSGDGEDGKDFEYINFDEFIIEVKNLSVSDNERGKKLLELCEYYSLLMKYDLYDVFLTMSEADKIAVLEKIPQRIKDYGKEIDLSDVLTFINEEVAVKVLKDSSDKISVLENTVMLYAKALNVDVGAESLYSKIQNKSKFASYFSGEDLSTKELIRDAFYKGVAVCLINEADRDNIKTRLFELNVIEGINCLNITNELDELSEMKSSKSDGIYAKIALINNFFGVKSIKETLSAYIDDADKGAGGTGGSGGGGSSGGSGGGLSNYGGMAAIADAKEEENKVKEPSKLDAYDDIHDAEWARIYINKLSQLGVISGFEGKIRPNDPITKEEFAKLIVNALGLTETAENMPFTDVNENDWYAEYVSKLYKSGISNGVSEMQFGAGTYISREDMAVLIYRALLNSNSIENSTDINERFADHGTISDYALEAVYIIKALNIVNGVGDNKFMPKGICSRAMAFKVISEAFYK